MNATFTGKLLVSEVINRVNKVARALDSTVQELDTYHHSQIEVLANEQNTPIPITVDLARILYLKAISEEDNTPAEIIFELDGYSGSVTTGEIKASEILLLNTDIIAVKASNDGDDTVLIEVIAAGD